MLEHIDLTNTPFPCTHCNSLNVYLAHMEEGWTQEDGDILYEVFDEHPHCRTCGQPHGNVAEYAAALAAKVEDGFKYEGLLR